MPLEQAADSPLPMEALGIYRLESVLGRGGMGEVYLAWDEMLERHVAIKRVLGQRLGDEVCRARFLREARTVARLDHPSIVRIHHVLERDGDPFLVMEYVRGRDFSKLPAGDLPVADVVSLGFGVAEGLAAAHAQGLVHRDLKLANLMSTPDGAVKILDFGLATARRRPEDEPSVDPTHDDRTRDDTAELRQSAGDEDSLTGEGVLVGTVHAMSPEQATSGSLDHRSDLFSFGGVLYELLGGVPPFRGASMLDTLRRVVSEEPAPLEHLAPDAPVELVALVHELLAKDREQRPANARVVAERLAKLAERMEDLELPRRPAAVERIRVRSTQHSDGSESSDPVTPDSPTVGIPAPAGPTDPRETPQSGLVLRTALHISWPADGAHGAQAESVTGLASRLATRFDGHRAPLAATDEAAVGERVLLFFRPAEAVAFALALHDELARSGSGVAARVGIHLGEVALDPSGVPASHAASHEVLATAARLARGARERQTLLGRAAFDLARGARAPESLIEADVRWLAHGAYLFEDQDDPYEIFEVGRDGSAPLDRPAGGRGLQRSVALSQELALGWRPATGQPIPRRPGWQLVERLGEGGFGEVWLARRESGDAPGEERVFKFCFEPERLRALKREVTLFRLLRETLGHRDDIARVLDWNFDEAPYFLESEYTDGGDLARWAEQRGGLDEVPMRIRLELVAEVADALAAAHSVGVLHKDVKPANVLVGHDDDGRPKARLTDFGIGLLTDRERLQQPGFTVLGFTEMTVDVTGSVGGTVQYMAPELLEGKPATTQADVYSLGVVLYQIVVGDFDRALASGWQRQIDDPLLRDDIAACVDGAPEHRLQGPAELAERLRNLGERRTQREATVRAAAAERRTRKRRRIASWLGSFAAVLLVVVSVFAWQTYQARQQAEQRRQQAERLIDYLLGDLRSELQPIGKLDILDKVGDEAMKYFAAVDQEDLSPEEIANYSKALHQIGQVRFGLGKLPEAEEAFRESLEFSERLSATDRDSSDWLFELGQSQYWLGYLYWKQSEFAQARPYLEKYRDVSERLAARDPANARWQMELAYSHSSLGSIYESQGSLDRAVGAYRQSVRVFEGLPADVPVAASVQTELAQVKGKLGNVLRVMGELLAARTQIEEAAELFRRASARRPDDMNVLRLVGVADSQVAELSLKLGDTEAALSHLGEALGISRRLTTHDPSHRLWQADLAKDLNLLARTELEAGNLDAARQHLLLEREQIEELLEDDVDRREWRFLEARNETVSAALRLRQGETRAAVDGLERPRRVLRDLLEESDALTYADWLVFAHLAAGSAWQATGRDDEARSAWAQGLTVVEAVLEEHRSPDLLASYCRLLVLTGRRDEAARCLRRLETMGYRLPSFRSFVHRHGLA